MTENKNSNLPMENAEFEIPQDLLEEVLSNIPPESVVEASNPCTVGINNIIAGIVLSCITLNFLALGYILPTLGSILLLLGFRQLRGENKWFKAGYVCSIIKIALLTPLLWINSTIYAQKIFAGYFGIAFQGASIAVQMIMLFNFWMAVNQVQNKAEIKEKSHSAAALFMWYVVLIGVALLGLSGTLPALIMFIAFVLIIICLVNLSKAMNICGYAITPSTISLSDVALSYGILALIAAGIIAGYAFFGSYNMNWQPAKYTTGNSNEIYAKLAELGYPEEQLKDLSEEELLLLKDASCVVAETNNFALISSENDFTFTNVAVRIAGDGSKGELWRVIHHFSYADYFSCKGTSNLQLWPLERMQGWRGTDDISGRLLCNIKGEALESEFYNLEKISYTKASFWGGYYESFDVMGDFSMPRKGNARRGYIAYTSRQIEDGYMLDSWANITQQNGRIQYPVKTAGSFRREGMHLNDYPFVTRQDAIQFYVSGGEPVKTW